MAVHKSWLKIPQYLTKDKNSVYRVSHFFGYKSMEISILPVRMPLFQQIGLTF